MFFFLSKVLFFLIQPINWILALLFLSWFAKRPKRKKQYLVAGIVCILFFTNSMLFNVVAHWWEVETLTADQITTPFEVAILLGGHSDLEVLPNHDRYNLGTSGNRISQTLELYLQGKVKKILLTGGSSDLRQQRPSESIEATTFLQRMGVKSEDILVEPKARNTRENAVFTANLLSQDSLSVSYLLVTSAFHMHRARGCFDKVGIQYVPYATDYWSKKTQWNLKFFLQPDILALYKWTQLIKEWIGILVYKIVDYV